MHQEHEGVESELGSEAPVTVDKKILVEQITTLEQISSEVFPPRQTVAGLHLVLELTDDVANVHIQLLHTGLVTIARVGKLSISCGKKRCHSCGKKRCHDLGYRLQAAFVFLVEGIKVFAVHIDNGNDLSTMEDRHDYLGIGA